MLELVEFWVSTIKIDAIYLKNFDKIQYKNLSLFENFIVSSRRLCHSMFTAIIGDFVKEDPLKNFLYDIYRIDLNAVEIYNSLKVNTSTDTFDFYLNQDKKCLWSLENLDYLPYKIGSRRSLIIGFYSIIYSLPGMVLLKQGDELEYEQTTPSQPKIYRWNDLDNHSGFSPNFADSLMWLRVNSKQQENALNQTKSYPSSTLSQSILHEFGFDVKYAQKDSSSLFNFLVLLNTRVKPNLVDIRQETVARIFTTTMFPIKPKAPVTLHYKSGFFNILKSICLFFKGAISK